MKNFLQVRQVKCKWNNLQFLISQFFSQIKFIRHITELLKGKNAQSYYKYLWRGLCKVDPSPQSVFRNTGHWYRPVQLVNGKAAAGTDPLTQLPVSSLLKLCQTPKKFLLILRNLFQQTVSSDPSRPQRPTDAWQTKSQPKSNCHTRKMSLHLDRQPVIFSHCL